MPILLNSQRCCCDRKGAKPPVAAAICMKDRLIQREKLTQICSSLQDFFAGLCQPLVDAVDRRRHPAPKKEVSSSPDHGLAAAWQFKEHPASSARYTCVAHCVAQAVFAATWSTNAACASRHFPCAQLVQRVMSVRLGARDSTGRLPQGEPCCWLADSCLSAGLRWSPCFTCTSRAKLTPHCLLPEPIGPATGVID